jgi:Outer membrane protein beta-barrel domain
MNKNLYILLILFIVVSLYVFPGTAYSQLIFGLNTGLTYNGLTGDAPEDAAYKRALGFTAGLHAEYSITNDILLGLGARYYGTGTIVTYDVGEKETVDSFDISMSYISIPVTFKVLTGSKHTYFTSGLDYRYLLKAELKYLETSLPEKDVKDRVQNYEAAIFAGFGGLITFGKPSIGLELRYSHSLNNISKDNTSPASGLPARFRFTGFQLLMFFNYSTK